MSTVRIALPNIRYPSSAEASVTLAAGAIRQAGRERAALICFPECYVPGYRVGLVAELDLSRATGLLASRYRPSAA